MSSNKSTMTMTVQSARRRVRTTASLPNCEPSTMRYPHAPQNCASWGISRPHAAHRTIAYIITPLGSKPPECATLYPPMSQVLDRVLSAARQLGASDVHLKAGLPPIFRIKGELRTVRDVPALTREVIATFAMNIMSERQKNEFEANLEADLAYGTPDGVRYRVNVFQQRGMIGMV